jgi:hypothetical protein
MRVDRVTAVLRYSAEAKGAWRTVELGAEATVDPEEDWALAQQGLYTRLTSQLREVWGWGKACPSLGRRNGHNPEHAQNGPEKPVEAAWEELKGAPRTLRQAQESHRQSHTTIARNTRPSYGVTRRTAKPGIVTGHQMEVGVRGKKEE